MGKLKAISITIKSCCLGELIYPRYMAGTLLYWFVLMTGKNTLLYEFCCSNN